MDETMAQSLHGSRLVRLLSDLNLSDTGNSGYHFGEKFAQLLHFLGAVNLSEVLKAPVAARFTRSDGSGAAVRRAFLSGQTDLVRWIAGSFLPATAHRKDRLPTAESLNHHCHVTGAFPLNHRKKSKPHAAVHEPYRQFYIGRQRMLDVRVQHLRSDIRNRIAGLSPELAKLARFDRVLAESLAAVPQEILARVPFFLERHFNRLLEKYWHALPENPAPADLEPWMAPGGWITTFCGHMREFLFAELEIRLQPVAGMIDALPEPAPGSIK